MMIGPAAYMEEVKRMSYLELMAERERLIGYLHKFETDEIAGDRSDPAWRICPKPDVRYQLYFDYLSVLCRVMRERYNQEYVWGQRTLNQDAKPER